MKPFELDRDNAAYIDELYQQYRTDPDSLDSDWIAFFKGFEMGFQRTAATKSKAGAAASVGVVEVGDTTGKGVYALVQAYRQFGHLIAELDPLGENRQSHPLLDLEQFGLSEDDLDTEVSSGGFMGKTNGTLRSLLAKLRATYCQTIGVEYTPISQQRDWLRGKIEPALNRPRLSADQDMAILTQLLEAEAFERFLHKRYLGQKRFSLEGSEALMPLLHTLVEGGAELGVEEMVIGMAHRGRLNVLTHLLHKPYEALLSEFEGVSQSEASDAEGDVKYHQGYSYDHITPGGRRIHLSLSPNPSHLELVDPVIEGMVKAKQDYLHDVERSRVVPVQIHGEAAFTGQGIVAETLNLSQLEGYENGGTIHIIINNQLGYTATPAETRFTPYPTDVAKQVQAPVLHVNANDPEAVIHAARLAIEFRQEFKRDVLIDLWGYRRHGHNEADDATLTQPLMYQKIAKAPTVTHLYSWKLIAQNKLSPEALDEIQGQIEEKLNRSQDIARKLRVKPHASAFGGVWQGMTWAGSDWNVDTAISASLMHKIKEGTSRVPEGFTPHRTVQRIMRSRVEMLEGKASVDWGGAEMLAFGSLLLEGVPVRLSGQDSQRGTFAHRHAVWHDVETGVKHVPLAALDRDQADFEVINSMLSELAVLGFEYGVSSADPRRLVLWEAQFGDFINGAQMIIDQFLCSGEAKWQRMCGLVLLLPHGYEGQGPEHSSARLERFLQSCAKNNMQVCYPTTPAQLFHLLRRQMLRNFRKPLVVMTPKSLLRHKQCVSDIGEFTTGRFRNAIDDGVPAGGDPTTVQRILLCSGKIYYDLLAAGGAEREGVAVVRLEQLYPFPEPELEEIFQRYSRAEEVLWVQEESRNMGAWNFVRPLLDYMLPDGVELGYIGRDEAASPATGVYQVHLDEQQEIVEQALALRDNEVVLADLPKRVAESKE
jgi:2-oxoglutarate dehydrogenase E1 component